MNNIGMLIDYLQNQIVIVPAWILLILLTTSLALIFRGSRTAIAFTFWVSIYLISQMLATELSNTGAFRMYVAAIVVAIGGTATLFRPHR